MGQYFIAVNKTKKEYIRAWDIGGGAKLFTTVHFFSAKW